MTERDAGEGMAFAGLKHKWEDQFVSRMFHNSINMCVMLLIIKWFNVRAVV